MRIPIAHRLGHPNEYAADQRRVVLHRSVGDFQASLARRTRNILGLLGLCFEGSKYLLPSFGLVLGDLVDSGRPLLSYTNPQ